MKTKTFVEIPAPEFELHESVTLNWNELITTGRITDLENYLER